MLRRLSAAVLLVLAVATAWSLNREVIYNDAQSGFSLLDAPTEGKVMVVTDTARGSVNCGDADLSFTLRLRNAGKRRPFRYSVYMVASTGDTLRLSVESFHGDDPLRDEEMSKLTLYVNRLKIKETSLPRKRFDNGTLFNTLRLERKGGNLIVDAGRGDADVAIWIAGGAEYFPDDIHSIGVVAESGNRVEIERMQLVLTPSAESRLSSGLTAESIRQLVSDNPQSPCGLWTLLDFDLDDRYMRSGGDYRLAILPWEELPRDAAARLQTFGYPTTSFAVIYLDGATVDASRWKPGMLKGVMLPTALSTAWRIVWFDSEGETIDSPDMPGMSTGSLDASGNILQIAFPERYSSVRFLRSDVGMESFEEVIHTEIGE